MHCLFGCLYAYAFWKENLLLGLSLTICYHRSVYIVIVHLFYISFYIRYYTSFSCYLFLYAGDGILIERGIYYKL